MYKPKYLKIQNIGTFSDVSYDFKIGQSQIIQGKNLDDKGQKSNGVGKSFFIDSIAFAITGLVLSGRSLEELINDKEETAYIELSLINNSDEFLIKRYLSRKKPQLIEIFKNGVAKHTNESDVNQRNQFIIDEIGITKEDLFKFFLISKDRYKPYFRLSDNEKKEITVRFSNANKIDEVFPLIEKDLNKEQTIEANLNANIIKFESQKESYEKIIEDFENQNSKEVKERLKAGYQNNIDTLLLDITQKEDEYIHNENVTLKELTALSVAVDKSLVECDRNILLMDESITKLQKERQDIESEGDIEINKINESINDVELELTSIRKDISENNSLKNEIELLISQTSNELKSSIECPSCNHEFIIDSDKTVEELKAILKELEDTLEATNINSTELKKKYDSKNNDILTLRNDISAIRQGLKLKTQVISQQLTELNSSLVKEEKSKREKSSEKNTIQVQENYILHKQKTIKNDIQENKDKIEELKLKIVEVDTQDNTELLVKYTELINEVVKNIETTQSELKIVGEKIQNLNSWVLKFKSFKSYLANLSLKNIQDLINSYLQKMDTDLTVEIEGYKQKGKKVTEKITESILRNGFNIGSYNRFSGGERGRIDIGSILANQTLINNNAAPKGLDLILIDEVLESLDSTGIEGIIKSMDNINKTMLLITQNEINSLPDQTLTFIKQNGTTTIC